jgi:hypothetical protein
MRELRERLSGEEVEYEILLPQMPKRGADNCTKATGIVRTLREGFHSQADAGKVAYVL